MTDHAVVIAGAGPAGLMLAGALALAGVGVAVIERIFARLGRGAVGVDPSRTGGDGHRVGRALLTRM